MLSLKLCFINPTRQGRAVVYKLAKQLARNKRYEIIILQPITGSRMRDRTRIQPTNNIEVIYFPSFFFPNINYNIPSFRKETRILRKLLLEEKCEIIQACDYDYLSSIAPVLIKKKYKTPIVLTTDAFPGYSWSYGNGFVDVTAKLYTYGIGKMILCSYDAVVLLYQALSEEAKTLGVPSERIRVIPNGVDFEQFRQNLDVDALKAQLSVRDDERVLLYVGRLSTGKRIEILIALTKTLLKEGFKLKTIIVGEGPCRRGLERFSKSIEKNIVFTGYIPHSQVQKYYLLADLFVLPSLSEGLPTVLLEAAAAGKPCVASNVNGVPDVVIHKETGFLVDKLDLDSYVHYVKLLLADENLQKRMGKKAEKHAKESFNWGNIVNQYDKIYRQLVN